jgi:hypothetical protein
MASGNNSLITNRNNITYGGGDEMSLDSPYSISPGWKVDPDGRQDRKPGPVTTRQMTEDEIKKYGIVKGEDEEMGTKIELDENVLMEICRIYGTGKDGATKAAEVMNLTIKQAENQIYLRKIRRKLDAEKTVNQQEAVEEVREAVEEEKKTSEEPLSEETQQEEIMNAQLPDTLETETHSDLSGVLEVNRKLICEIFKVPESLISEMPEYPAELSSQITAKQLPEESQPEKINNAEASDIMEPETYPNLKNIAADLSKQVDEAIKNLPEPTPEPEIETVNHPVHYTAGSIEVIDYLQDKMPPEMFEGFCVGNSLKYLSRYRYKGGLEDLKKAQWYLNRIIKVKEAS